MWEEEVNTVGRKAHTIKLSDIHSLDSQVRYGVSKQLSNPLFSYSWLSMVVKGGFIDQLYHLIIKIRMQEFQHSTFDLSCLSRSSSNGSRTGHVELKQNQAGPPRSQCIYGLWADPWRIHGKNMKLAYLLYGLIPAKHS